MPNHRITIKMNQSGMRKTAQEIKRKFEQEIEHAINGVDLKASHEEQQRQVKMQLQTSGIALSPELVQQIIDKAKSK